MKSRVIQGWQGFILHIVCVIRELFMAFHHCKLLREDVEDNFNNMGVQPILLIAPPSRESGIGRRVENMDYEC